MGATQSLAGGSGPSSSSTKPNPLGPGTNQAAVAALIRHRMSQGQAPPDVYRPNYVTLFEDKRFASSPSAPPRAAPSAPAGSSAAPPPACPMHDPSASQGMSGGSSVPFSSRQASSSSSAGSSSSSSASSLLNKINPLNMMPDVSQDRLSQNQKVELSTERTISSIPRAPTSAAPGGSPYDEPSACPVPKETRDAMAGGSGGAAASAAASGSKETSSAQGEGNWEYPSAQQFYNALVRKGWETPEEHVDMMVLVHNFLNERAWREVCAWEEGMGVDSSKISLARFQGRPGTLSPKARLFSLLGTVAPSRFSSDPPFDRHDWVVRRPAETPDAPPKDMRYVIDYYQEPDDPTTEEPVFYLDVRPALDSFEAVSARIKVGLEEFRKDGFAGFKVPEGKENQEQKSAAASA